MKRGIIIILCFCFSTIMYNSVFAQQQGPPHPEAVAIINNGAIQLLQNRLVTEFKDGGTITHFEIQHFADGPNLVRVGQNSNGESRVEAIALEHVGGHLFVDIAKMAICNASCHDNQGQNGFGFCQPNSDKTDCYCNGNASEVCRFGTNTGITGSITTLYDIVIIP